MPDNGEPNHDEEEGIAPPGDPVGAGVAGAAATGATASAGAAAAGQAAASAAPGPAAGVSSSRKLIPEWDVDEDDQVLAAGLAVLLAMLALFGWSMWRGGDDDSPLDDVVPVTAAVDDEVAVEEEEVADAPTTTEAPVETTIPSPLDLTPDVAAAAGAFGITGFAENETAILEGFVGNDDESAAAEDAAAAVPGIISVDNRLVVLQPSVQAALEEAGVAEAAPTVEGTVATAIGVVGNEDERDAALVAAGEVEGVTEVVDRLRILQPDALSALTDAGVANPGASATGTVVTVTGTVDSEEDRAAALEAAAVPGVTEVIDQLTVRPAVAEELNALFVLEPIQFATGSATILDVSFPTLDAATEILLANPDVVLEVQGYTDVRGGDDANLALSQARADAVRAYLVSQAVAEDTLTAVGYGETTQFGEGESPEALAANRRVQFVQE